MAISLIALAALAFVSLCWLIGARSRLLRLRDATLVSSRQLSDALKAQAEWLMAQAVSLNRADDANWQRVHAAAAQVLVGLVLPPKGKHVPSWDVVSAAHAVQMHAIEQIHELDGVLLHQSEKSIPKDSIPQEKIDFHLHADRVRAATQAHNEASVRHNQAIAMFPAQALAGLLRLRAAQPFSEPLSTP